MSKIEKLTEVLEKLNHNPEDATARAAAKELVSEITPLELSLAEQKLIEDGLEPECLQHLCAIHLEVLEGELAQFRNSLPTNHPVAVMMTEHDQLLGFLVQLDQLNRRLQKLAGFDASNPDFALLATLAEKLLAAENHHQREEQALFPVMEELGITGPPHIMCLEHDALRIRKHALLELAQQAEAMNYDEFKTKLAELAGYLVFNLRDHIFKENNILYPSAMETITEDSVWEAIQAKCDQIGYCSFTQIHG